MIAEGNFPPDGEIFVGVSGCLLGEKVRHDGSDREMPWLAGNFPEGFIPVPVCPEVEVGMGVPRETVVLRQSSAGVRMVAPTSASDHTEAMERWARARLKELAKRPLSGFILKSRSPSCGLDDVPIEGGASGSGLFAAALQRLDGLLPLTSEEGLTDAPQRSAFFRAVEAYQRLAHLQMGGVSVEELRRIHRREELLLLSLAEGASAELERGVVDNGDLDPRGRGRAYLEGFLQVIASGCFPRNHRLALEEAQRRLHSSLEQQGRKNLAGLVASSLAGDTPLVVALAAIRHHALRVGLDALGQQTYLASSAVALEGQ